MSALATPVIEAPAVAATKPGVLRRLLKNTSVLIGGVMVLAIMLMGLLAPMLTSADPAAINPSNRNKLPGFETTMRDDDGNKVTRIARMGTDSLGRDIYTRVVWGARVSLTVGLAVAVLSVAIGLAIGLAAGYFRALDGVVMRVMDGLMAIPPADVDPVPYFALLDELAERHGLPLRSMGMSGDYETAVMLGATHVRVGTALFGVR